MAGYGSNEPSPIDWALMPLRKYAAFKGRSPRAEYWWFYLGTVIVGVILGFLGGITGIGRTLADAANLGLFVPWIAVTVRRLHDTDRSGWWMLGLIGGAVALIAFMAMLGASLTASRAGFFTMGIVAILAIGGAMITFFVFMVLPGTEGSNRYGADPYGPGDLEEVFA